MHNHVFIEVGGFSLYFIIVEEFCQGKLLVILRVTNDIISFELVCRILRSHNIIFKHNISKSCTKYK